MSKANHHQSKAALCTEHVLPRTYCQIGICLLVVLLAFSLVSLGRVPEKPSGDDGGYAQAAYQFWKTGHPGVPGYRGLLGLDRDMVVFGRISAAVQGVIMHIFGISLLTGLLPSFLVGLGVLFFTYRLGWVLWGKEFGALAAIMLAASGIFFNASHSARPDILLALCFMVALYLVASTKENEWSWRYPAAGLVMGLSGDVHLNGFLLAPIPFLFWLALRKEMPGLRLKVALSYGGAGLIGVTLWLVLHYWPDTAFFRRQFTLIAIGERGHIRVVGMGLLGAVNNELSRYLNWFWEARLHRHLYEGLVIATSAIWMMLLGRRSEQALVLVWFIFFLIAVLFMRNGFGWYLIYAWPIFALWMARVFIGMYLRHPFLATGALALLFVGYAFNHALWAGKALSSPSYSAISRELRSLIPTQSRVVAGGEWWFALHDRDFTDAQHMGFLALCSKAKKPGTRPPGWEGAWEQQRWEYAVADGDYRAMLDAAVSIEEAYKTMYASRKGEISEARSFALRHAQLVRRMKTGSDQLSIFRIE